MFPKLKKAYDDAKASATEIRDKAKAEDREFTADEQKAFDEFIAAAAEAKAAHEKAIKSAADLANLGDLPTPEQKAAPLADVAPAGNIKVRETPGEAFVKSAAYAQLLKDNPHGIPTGARVTMSPVKVGGLKTLLVDPHMNAPLYVTAPVAGTVTDLMNAITVVDDAPEVIRVLRGAFTNAAAEVAEGDAKPESALAWTPTTYTLATIATHIPVTTQALGHNAMMRSIIDALLVNGVKAKVEAQIATMLAAATGMQTQAFATDMRTTIRKAITKAINGGAQVGATPTGILIGTTDAETIDLESIANIVLQPGEGFAQMSQIWRLPIITATAIPSGFAYVGDLKQIVAYAGVGGVQVSTGWVNTQFTENELTILAETESVATTLVPAALVKADIIA